MYLEFFRYACVAPPATAPIAAPRLASFLFPTMAPTAAPPAAPTAAPPTTLVEPRAARSAWAEQSAADCAWAGVARAIAKVAAAAAPQSLSLVVGCTISLFPFVFQSRYHLIAVHRLVGIIDPGSSVLVSFSAKYAYTDLEYRDQIKNTVGIPLFMLAPGANNAIPFTHVGILLPFVSYLEHLGTPTGNYLQKAKIPLALLDHPEARIPLRLAYRFLNEACRAEGIENAGLDVGRATSLSDLGEFGDMLLRARNVLEYLQTGVRLVGAVTTGESYQLDREGEWIRFSHRHEGTGIPESDKQQGYLFSLSVTINTLRQIVGRQWCPPEVTLPTLGERAAAELSEWLPYTQVKKGSSVASFLFPYSFLALPMPLKIGGGPSRGATSIAHPVPEGFLASVQGVIESQVQHGFLTIETAAEAAGLSERTLRRRLAQCGTSYSDLVARTRVTLAEQWLAKQDRSIAEIASALGYTNRSNFTRAFRRLNGMSPQTYRDIVIRKNLR